MTRADSVSTRCEQLAAGEPQAPLMLPSGVGVLAMLRGGA